MDGGSEIGPYRIERLLGRGGMGEVWLATHATLDRRVALKLLPAELGADPRFRTRFLAESRLAASLDHPHIVPIYEAGEADGRLFIAMRYVEGRDLASLIATDGPLSAARAVSLLRGIADALDAAHDRGLVHRDVKPGNILVSPTARAGEHAYLADFGLTKQLGSGADFTRSGQILGSLGYVAPEQIEGRPVDPRTDVYSLACVLYETLTGRPPFVAERDVATLWAHLQSARPRPSEIRPELAPFDEVIAQGMAIEPAGRYPSAGELLAAGVAAGGPHTVEIRTGTHVGGPLPLSWRPIEPLIGREVEVARAVGELEVTRLVSLTGLGGSGKTRVARSVIDVLGARGVETWFVDLGGTETASLVGTTILAAMRVEGLAPDDPLELVGASLRDKNAVVCLDGVEQVNGVAPIVMALLDRTPGLRLLITSRIPVGVLGEVELAVPMLSLPPNPSVLAVRQSAAGSLFLARARAVGGVPTLTQENASAITTLLERLGGLPLAIELAARRTRAMSPEEILERLEARGADAIDAKSAGRHDSLRSVIEWSLATLTPAELTTIEAVSICAGFDFDLARALVPDDDVVDAMYSLVAAGLVAKSETIDGTSRFRLLDPVKDTVARRLSPARLKLLSDRLARRFLDVADEWQAGGSGGWDATLIERLDVVPTHVVDRTRVPVLG